MNARWRSAAAAATLVMPVFLLHGRGIADGLLVAVVVLFLLHAARGRWWAWLRTPWLVVGLVWWGWQVACSAPAGAGSFVQAAGLLRFLLFAAALEHWVLTGPAVRRWLARVLRWAAAYLALQSLLQLVTGRNLYGYGRGPDRELTGPYEHPRAGPPLARLLYPAILPPAARLRPWAGALLLAAGLATVLLIGQRIPFLLSVLGLFTTALILPRLRVPVLAAAVAGGALLAASPVLAPAAYYRLVTKFSAQMEGFAGSPYGGIVARAWAIARAHPWTGGGYDAFRRLCPDPAYFRGWDGGDGGGAAMCVQHPHNHYLEALVNAGWPGLALFAALVAAWLLRLGRGLWRRPDPLRAGLFTAALLHEFPLASASAFASMPLTGWFIVLLGLGLAETRAYMERTAHGGTSDVRHPDTRDRADRLSRRRQDHLAQPDTHGRSRA